MINIQAFPWFQLKLLVEILLSPIIILIPRNRRKIVFGAWKGKQFSCNPRYLCEYVARRGGFKCIWIGNKDLQAVVQEVPGVTFVPKTSIKAFWHAITAWFYVFNINWEDDIIRFPRYGRVNLIYVCHGYVDKGGGRKKALPKKGRKVKSLQWLRDVQWKLWRGLYKKESWCSECSELAVKTRLEQQVVGLHPERMLRYGNPRSDYFLINGHSIEEKMRLRKKYSQILGLPLDKKWFIFVPTWRHNKDDLYSFAKTNRLAELDRILTEQNAVIIEKQHPIVLETMRFDVTPGSSVHVISRDEARKLVLQELLMACDRMITDVSSVFFDFFLMDRPVIHYVYDYEHFMDVEFGFVYDIRKYHAGPLAYDEIALFRCLGKSDKELLSERTPKLRNHLLTYVQGNSCYHYYELMKKLSKSRHYFVPKFPNQL